jgi:anti-anti-sigma factor
MSIDSVVSDNGQCLTIYIGQRFDFSQHRMFRQAYEKINLAQTRIIVDMNATAYMDSSALGMLLVLRERSGGDDSNITLKGVRTEVLQVLQVSRFNQLFKLE